MSEKLADGRKVTHTLGGMIEFERTGIYPNKLTIKSSKFFHTWSVQGHQLDVTSSLSFADIFNFDKDNY
jgi:hypothetical protein